MKLRELGERIGAQRRKRGLRQADIARALQVSAQAVSKWERGQNAPDIGVLVGLSRLLGVSVEWLLGGTAAETDTFDGTVFCTALDGFARRAAELAPQAVATWANSLHVPVTEAVKHHDGVPVKYVGDGALAFFAGRAHAERALAAGREALAVLNNPDLAVVLHAGPIYLGSIGHPDYAQPDIMGQTINTAFLVMNAPDLRCAGTVTTTEAVLAAMEEPAALTPAGEVHVRGHARPLAVYQLPAARAETRERGPRERSGNER
jgi:class 3 adenylate cyclase